MQITTWYPWENRRDVFLTGYVQQASQQFQVGQKKPAVIICPGGAYLKISDQEAECVALRFASNGYHAFVLTYSVGSSCAMPTPLLEIAGSILYVRRHAEEWLIDAEKIVVCGFSAGGHLCASISTGYEQAAELMQVEPELVRPNAAILGYPVVDLTLELPPLPLAALSGPVADPLHPEDAVLPAFRCCIAEANGETCLRLDQGMLRCLIGTAEPTPEQRRQYSPVFHVSAHTPPTYLWNTCNDEMVPAENSLRYAQALMAHGVKTELHMFADGPHGLSLADHTSAVGPEYLNAAVRQWVPMAMTWLTRLWQE